MNESPFIKSEILKTSPKYEDEPMEIGELLYDEYDEEGEIHSSGEEDTDCLNSKYSDHQRVRSAQIFDRFLAANKTDSLKKLERAKRFSIPFEETRTENVTLENLARLHKTLGIDRENERHYRFNAIHMRGTQDMSTEDVFEYFSRFSPSSIEWINDVSCNVVWIDDISAAKALLNLSKELKNLDKIHANANPFEMELKTPEFDMDCDDASDSVDAREINAAIPPGYWRIGTPSEKSSAILLRFATRNDTKQKNAERNSEYYKRYGNPHFGNITGLVSKSRREEIFRKHRRPNRQGFENTDSDDGKEHYGYGKKNPWGHLAKEWNEQDEALSKASNDVRSKIVLKRRHPNDVEDLRMSINSKLKQRNDLFGTKHGESYRNLTPSDDGETESRVKFPRMRMYADEENANISPSQSHSHGKLNSYVKAPPVEDLRNKIDRKKRNKKMLMSSSRRKTLSNPHYNSADEDDDYEDEKDSSNWALEQYSDLRESLEQNKKYRHSHYKRASCYSDSDGIEIEVSDNESDDVYRGQLGHRSPLQIEIENDGYFENESDTTV